MIIAVMIEVRGEDNPLPIRRNGRSLAVAARRSQLARVRPVRAHDVDLAIPRLTGVRDDERPVGRPIASSSNGWQIRDPLDRAPLQGDRE